MDTKVTLQDIANLAGISRNTVSKIVNGRYNGSPKVKEQVLRLLRENNYKGLGQEVEKPVSKTILLLCKDGIALSSFFLYLVNEIQRNVEVKGYLLQFYGIRPEEIQSGQIPWIISGHQVDGIVCMDIFQKDFIKKLIGYGIPVVFLDFCSDMWAVSGKYDVVLMNNKYPVYTLTQKLIDKGCCNIGFVGDYRHCMGFYDRYMGYCDALSENQIPLDQNMCVTFADADGYGDKAELWKYLKRIKQMPDAFVVANDKIAIALMQALQERAMHIPEDISIVAFDDIAEAALVKPALTTVNSNREALSRSVVECLLQRMAEPDRPRRIIYVDTEIVYRDTIRK